MYVTKRWTRGLVCRPDTRHHYESSEWWEQDIRSLGTTEINDCIWETCQQAEESDREDERQQKFCVGEPEPAITKESARNWQCVLIEAYHNSSYK